MLATQQLHIRCKHGLHNAALCLFQSTRRCSPTGTSVIGNTKPSLCGIQHRCMYNNSYQRSIMSKKRDVLAFAAESDLVQGMLPLQYTGQVMSASSNMVRVELDAPLRTTEPGQSSNQGTSSETATSTSSSTSVPAVPRTQLLCSIRTLIKKLNQTVVVGDRVRVGAIDWNQGKGMVEEVYPRQSELVDPAVSNVDFALLVFALNNPPFEEVQVTRFLISMEASGIPFRLLLNKADLISPEELKYRIQQVRSWGYEPLVVSCAGDGSGLDEVMTVLAGKTSVVAGPSGAGKSSLINAIRLGRHRADQSSSAGQQQQSSHQQVEYYGSPPLKVPSSVLKDDELESVATAAQLGQTDASSHEHSSEDDSDDGFFDIDSSSSGNDISHSPQSDIPALASTGRIGWQEDASRPRERSLNAATSRNEPISVASRGGLIKDPGVSTDKSFLAVGDLNRIGRGKHTTTAVTLIKLSGGGKLADTPGFSQPALDKVSSTDLAYYFPEFQRIIEQEGSCQFNNCMHMMEPGCAINSQQPLPERFEWYLKFLLEIKEREETDVKSLQAGKRAREGNAKVKTERGGKLRAEAKLDSSKHRRTSRTRQKQGLMDALLE